MKKQPIHQNLNTSFVNVGALVRYLRGLQFVGSIRVELASYEAEIIFTQSGVVRAREYDHIAGRISHGEHALKRILIRAQEPHGLIHVYKTADGYAGHDGSVFVDKSIMAGAHELASSSGGGVMSLEIVLTGRDGENAVVLAALSEMLREIDTTLRAGRLSFASAFRIACDSIAPQFPFLQHDSTALSYNKGELLLTTDADPDAVATAVFAALQPIFQRLRGEIKYSELMRQISDRLVEIAAERRPELVQLGLIHHIENLLASE